MTRFDPSHALYVDLYQLTMGQAYLRSGQTAEATFSLFVRNLPPDRGFLLFAGLEDVLRYLEELRFTFGDLDYLRSTGQFGDDFIEYLARFRFTGSVRAMDEGTAFFANEPMIEVTAPGIEGRGRCRGLRRTPHTRHGRREQVRPVELHRRVRWHQQCGCRSPLRDIDSRHNGALVHYQF